MEHISKAQIKLVRSLQHKKFRDELGLFVAEGDKCVEELRKGFELVHLIVEDGLISHSGVVPHLIASRSEIEQMSGLETPQGVIAVFKKHVQDLQKMPDLAQLEAQKDILTLVLDGVQNPGNLGTIIRTADWFGVKHVICSQDTADCYNPKVVQATMGALTRVEISYADLPELLKSVAEMNRLFMPKAPIPVYGTLLDGKNMYEKGVIAANRMKGLIVMGNEGNGISEEVRKYITHPLRIPSYPDGAETSESLNVAIATAVVLAEFRRKI